MEEKDDICYECDKQDDCGYCCSGHCPRGKYARYYDIYDFKYSNNVDSYMTSEQLHLYKHFFELTNPGKRIRKLYFVFVPKSFLKQKRQNKTNPRDETIYEFRNRVIEDLENKEIQIKEVAYDPNKVIEYLIDTKHCIEDTEYIKNPTRLCDWCDYKAYCQEGIDYMNLPKNERRDITVSSKKKLWLYAPPFAGKTTLTDKFPDPLILTTDGNINNVTAPYVYIRDEVTVTGRITNRKFAWEVFKDTIEELEKKQNDFKTISLDLVEDTREMCRLYMYEKLGIQHESDSGFGKGWDVIKTEYLSTMRRFFNLDYENIIICSHEDVSKTLTKKSGEQITRIAPNIQEAIATKLAGMVDIVARIIVNDDGTRTISFKTDSVIFGGGRLNVTGREIPCDYDELMAVYSEASESSQKRTTSQRKTNKTTDQKAAEAEPGESIEEIVGQDSLEEQEANEKKLKRSRKSSKPAAEETSNDEPAEAEASESTNSSDAEESAEPEAPKEEEKPKTRKRKKRGE
jgi:phage nucleotide-binding protein